MFPDLSASLRQRQHLANFWSGNATSCEKEEREMESGLGEPTTTDFCICCAALPDARISQQIALLTKWGRKRTQITINGVDRAPFPSRPTTGKNKPFGKRLLGGMFAEVALVVQKWPPSISFTQRLHISSFQRHPSSKFQLGSALHFLISCFIILGAHPVTHQDGTNKTNDR